jgi:hypothetical protein
MEPMKSPCLHFATCNKLVANQYQFQRIILVLVPLMRKNEIKLHIFCYIINLVGMSIKD